MRLPPSWRLVGRARARLIGRARARMYGVVAVCLGVGLACVHVCAGLLWGRAVLLRVLSVNVARRGALVMRGSNALDGEALH